jgi:hypothetical protein
MNNFVLISTLVTVGVAAQTMTYSPLRVAVSAEGKIETTNTSDRPIRGFVVFLDHADANGRATSTQAFSQVWGDVLVNGKVVLFEPGKVARMPGGGSQEPIRTNAPQLGVDLVVFGDGTVWGPQRLKQSSRVLGWIEGMHMQRQSLKRVLDAQGPVEVANQITQLEQQTQRPR